MNKIVKLFTGIVLLASIGSMSACKKTFDEPPAPSDEVNIVANTTIATLKALHTTSGAYDIINSDIIISGIVTANDKSGNLYKQLFIQDTTGAMQILIDASSLYGTFPVGRRIFVRCKGLCLSDYHANMNLGVYTNSGGTPDCVGILSSDIGKYIVGGSINNPVEPIAVTYSDLLASANMQGRYINAFVQLEDYEFYSVDTMKTYSDTSAYKNTINDTIQNCSNNRLLVRNSAYADFAAQRLPRGNGSIAAIFTIYKSSPTSSNTDKQLLLRDTSDVKMYNPRCGSAPSNALLFENFEAYPANTTSPYSVLSITGWQNIAEAGPYTYTNRTFSSNKYAYISAFGSAATTTATWLITKGVNLNNTATETLTFDTKQDFRMSTYTGSNPIDVSSTLRVMYSTNYSGSGDPNAPGVTWTDFSGVSLSPGTLTGSAFPTAYTGSGNIDLSGISGTIYIAFKNEGADPAGTTSSDHTSAWEIDNIKIIGN